MNFKPHPYQQYCIDRIIADPAVGLFLDMGLGKTVITLTAVADLKYNRFQVLKALVIAPKKVAEATWTLEAQKWDHLQGLRVSTVLGSEMKRLRALAVPADVYVINRENVVWLVEYYRNNWPFDMVILDESSSFKNPRAKRFKAMKLVRGRVQRLVELTGTPAPNSLLDLWAQVYLLDGGARLGKTLTSYRDRYFVPGARHGMQIFNYRPKKEATKEVHKLISDICVSMKAADYIQLPPLVSVNVPVQLDAPARRAYGQMEHDLLINVDGETIDAQNGAVLSGKLLQLCNGAIYDENRGVHEIHRCKLDAFLETIEGLSSALVFYSYQHDRERLLQVLAKTGLRVREYKGPRDAEDWNNGCIDVLLAHPASTAYGLNLQQGGNHVIWFGLTWSLELYQQANKRLHRQGQTETVIVHNLVVKDGMDEDVMDALQRKEDRQEALLNALKARIQKVKGV